MDERIAEVIRDLCKNNIYMKNIGLEMIEMEVGHITGRIPVTEDIINPYGSVHGGALYAMADIVAGFTACTYGSYVSTVSGNLTYLKPCMNTKYITCKADVLHPGRKVTSVSIEIVDDNENLLETGTFVFCMMDKKII